MVWNSIVHAPHDDPPQLLIQSAQSASCSAPSVSVPPVGTLTLLVVAWELAVPPEVVVTPLSPLLSSLPHAAATSPRLKRSARTPALRLLLPITSTSILSRRIAAASLHSARQVQVSAPDVSEQPYGSRALPAGKVAPFTSASPVVGTNAPPDGPRRGPAPGRSPGPGRAEAGRSAFLGGDDRAGRSARGRRNPPFTYGSAV